MAGDLFSHANADQPAAQSDGHNSQPISRVDLFREPGAPAGQENGTTTP